jgi:hypothetical protein
MSDDLLNNYAAVKALAESLGRPCPTLMALAQVNDPFAIGPERRKGAEWFARLWHRFQIGDGIHVRRIHYRLISQHRPFRMSDGTRYENTIECWNKLGHASRDARYLDLVPADHFVDRRNSEAIEHLSGSDSDASLDVLFEEPRIEASECHDVPQLPRLCLDPPTFAQPYHVELWCEKTTVNDVLVSLAQQYGLNVVTGSGELSLTACVKLVERAEESGRPVRILYISDFDPAGQSMPVSVARKIEHRLRLKGLDLDIQVRPVALSLEQCRQYRLPRTPIKTTERRRAGFEQRFGEGATELDALEALHPGELAQILRREIGRYFDTGLDQRVRESAREIKNVVAGINQHVHAQHATNIDALEEEWQSIEAEHVRRIEQWRERAEPVWQAIAEELEEQAPNLDGVEWPGPEVADEDDDPLFDSTRDYVAQIDRYKLHQGKPIAGRRRQGEEAP